MQTIAEINSLYDIHDDIHDDNIDLNIINDNDNDNDNDYENTNRFICISKNNYKNITYTTSNILNIPKLLKMSPNISPTMLLNYSKNCIVNYHSVYICKASTNENTIQTFLSYTGTNIKQLYMANYGEKYFIIKETIDIDNMNRTLILLNSAYIPVKLCLSNSFVPLHKTFIKDVDEDDSKYDYIYITEKTYTGTFSNNTLFAFHSYDKKYILTLNNNNNDDISVKKYVYTGQLNNIKYNKRSKNYKYRIHQGQWFYIKLIKTQLHKFHTK